MNVCLKINQMHHFWAPSGQKYMVCLFSMYFYKRLLMDTYSVMDYVNVDRLSVYMEIIGTMHGLSQRGRIANKDQEKHIGRYGYYPTK